MTPENLEVLKWVSGVGGTIMSIAIIPLISFLYKQSKERREKRESRSNEISSFMKMVADSHEEIKLLNINQSHQLEDIKHKVTQTAMLLTATIETSPHAYFICDNEGLCIAANDALLKLFNAQLSEMIGFGWLSFIHPDHVSRVRQNWSNGVKDKLERIQDHYPIIDKQKFEIKGDVVIILHAAYKALFQYKNSVLEKAVGTVWSIDEDKTRDDADKRNKAFDCIIREFENIKGTPTWSQIREEIKNKK